MSGPRLFLFSVLPLLSACALAQSTATKAQQTPFSFDPQGAQIDPRVPSNKVPAVIQMAQNHDEICYTMRTYHFSRESNVLKPDGMTTCETAKGLHMQDAGHGPTLSLLFIPATNRTDEATNQATR